MLKIGITGGIGSGKSTICQVFELLGIPVFYADTVAKKLMAEDPVLGTGLREAFGEQTFNQDGSLNRAYLSGIVFQDEEELARLNALVHPAVFSAFDVWVSDQKAPYVIKEAALLYESGSYQLCDLTILVTAPEPLKIERIIKRDQITEEAARARMTRQMSDEEKIPMADFILKNDEGALLIPQILKLHQQFVEGGHAK